MSDGRAFLYLDFDSFFATAEQHFNPILRGKPVGVVPLDIVSTGCIAVSKEAKSLGIKFGATIRDARSTVPEMVFVVARPDVYVRLHHRAIEIIDRCVPIAKVRSIDEVVCSLLPSEAADGEGLAKRIKQALAAEFGETLTCSIGIASTELLAKVGAELNKPNGLVRIRDHELPQALARLKLQDLPGVSDGIEARLNAAGVASFEALWQIGPKHSRAIWGSVEGERFWNGLHGGETERPPTVKRMIGHSRMLPVDWRTTEKVRDCARQLALSAGRRLRRTDRHATKLSVSLKAGGLRTNNGSRKDDKKWSTEIGLPPSRSDYALLKALDAGLLQAQRAVKFKPRSVSVMLSGLCDPTELQVDLFAEIADQSVGGTDATTIQKWDCVSNVMDELRSAHGPSAISLGPKIKMPGGYLGSKIAFGRIPDLADFSETPSADEDTHFCSFGGTSRTTKPALGV